MQNSNLKRIILFFLICCRICNIPAQQMVHLKLNPETVENAIDEKLYGFLLEHLYHSVSNGLWGETVWNRSFEELQAHGNWTMDDKGLLKLDALNEKAIFYLGKGADYEVKLQFRKTGGEGGVFVGVRDQYREQTLTNRIYCYLGDNGNTCHKLEANTGWIWHTPVVSTTVVGHQPGYIEPDMWYTLKMKAKGNRIQVWMNQSQLFDNEIDNCPKDGAVALGAEYCNVEFRNIEITSLDGNDFNMSLQPVRHWQLVGKGKITAVKNSPLNHKYSVLICAKGKTAGVEQLENFSVRPEDLLTGSVYLRGNVKTAVVQLSDGKKVISEQKIDSIGNNWNEYMVNLPVEKECRSATLRILTREKGDFYIDQVSLMHESSIAAHGFSPVHLASTGALKPTVIRWPGGSFVELYDFTKGIGPQNQREGILRWDDFDPLSFGTDEFMEYCKITGAEPLIVVPIGYHNYDGYNPDKYGKTDWLQKALDWIEYCNGDITTEWGSKRAANGHPEPYNVKYWEIDNEVWKMDPALYAQLARIFSIEMKKKDPSIQIIGCGSGRLGKEGAGLDSVMIHTVAEYIDYISPHYYQTIDKYGNDGVEEYGRYLDQLALWIDQSKNPDMKIYLSEWNLDGIDMRTGLFAGGFLNRLERTPKVTMAAPALFLRHISAPGWNNAFINFDRNGWFPAPNYVVFKLWRKYYLPLRVELKGAEGELNAIATKSEDNSKICIKMVNPSDQEINVSIDAMSGYKYSSFEIVSAFSLNERNTMDSPDVIKALRKDVVEGNDKNISLILPAYSATVLSLLNQ